jgi:hypothetical protein
LAASNANGAVTQYQQFKRLIGDAGVQSSEPILDIKRLENVHASGKGTEAACPACRAKGKDTAGDNLMIFADGRYKCAAHISRSAQENHEHNQEIYRLAGIQRHDDDYE